MVWVALFLRWYANCLIDKKRVTTFGTKTNTRRKYPWENISRNQYKVNFKTCTQLEAQKNVSDLDANGFSFAFDWLRESGASFSCQSQDTRKQTQCNPGYPQKFKMDSVILKLATQCEVIYQYEISQGYWPTKIDNSHPMVFSWPC